MELCSYDPFGQGKDDVPLFRVVCRDEEGKVIREFKPMTGADLCEALDLALRELSVALMPSTRLFFVTNDGAMSWTVEYNDGDA